MGSLVGFLLKAGWLSLDEAWLLLGLYVSRRPALSGSREHVERCCNVGLGSCESRARRTCLRRQCWLLYSLRYWRWLERMTHCLRLRNKRLGFPLGRER